MKKFFWAITIITLLFFLFVFPLFFLPPARITLKSDVPISIDDVLCKKGMFYKLYSPKKPVKIERNFWKARVMYEEPVIGNIRFSNGQFAITLKGHIIKLINNNKGEDVSADMDSNEWSEDFSKLFYELKDYNMLDDIEKFCLYKNSPAFYDKNGILVIMGYESYNDKILEYKKTLSLYDEKRDSIERIDLRYENEAVLTWRKQ